MRRQSSSLAASLTALLHWQYNAVPGPSFAAFRCPFVADIVPPCTLEVSIQAPCQRSWHLAEPAGNSLLQRQLHSGFTFSIQHEPHFSVHFDLYLSRFQLRSSTQRRISRLFFLSLDSKYSAVAWPATKRRHRYRRIVISSLRI